MPTVRRIVIVLSTFCLLVFVCVVGVADKEQSPMPGARYRYERSPPARPAERASASEEIAINRGIYGGKGDKSHLGGFTAYDHMGISNNTFNFIMGGLAIRSLIDVGCGKGVSTKYFHDQGVQVLCVEGSHDAVTQSLLPSDRIIEHDFSLGPWWPAQTFDAAWSLEFLEHVGRQYMDNYLPIFHKSALIFVHANWWWKARFTAAGFYYSRELSQEIRKVAAAGHRPGSSDAQHIIHGMMVFINPAVASLPQHRHLIGGHGCYADKIDNLNGGQPCKGADRLPMEYEALLDCQVEQTIWSCHKNPRARRVP